MSLHIGAAVAHIASIRSELAQHTGCPEWDHGGIRAAFIATEGAPCDVSAAACLAAGDPGLRLPSAGGFKAHWPKNATAAPRVSLNQPCPEHPDHDMPHDHGCDMTPEQTHAAMLACIAAAAAARIPNPTRPTLAQEA